MKAIEIRDRMDEILEEFGNVEMFLADVLEPEWRHKVTSVEFEADRQSGLISADG